MENISFMLKMSIGVVLLLLSILLLKYGEVWEGCSKFCNFVKIFGRKKDFFLELFYNVVFLFILKKMLFK